MTVEIDRLYGAMHATSVNFNGLMESEVMLRPSPLLLEELARLPSGTLVGVEELTPEERKELEHLVINGKKISVSEGTTIYWQKIIEHCQKHGLEICYLEDMSSWIECIQQGRQLIRLREKIRKQQDEEKRKALLPQAYALSIRADYGFAVEREQRLLQRIAQMRPKVVLLGRGHTDVLWELPELALAHNLKFKSYAAEDLPDMSGVKGRLLRILGNSQSYSRESAEKYLSEGIEPNRFSATAYPLIANVAERESLERRHRALKTGRIVLGRTPDFLGYVSDETFKSSHQELKAAIAGHNPDFIGTWDTGVPLRGLFELFIIKRKDDSITGIIEDTVGSATFFGEIRDGNDGWIKFHKRYTQTARFVGSRVEHINYYGEKKDGTFHGTFEGSERDFLLHDNYVNGRFEMIPFQGPWSLN